MESAHSEDAFSGTDSTLDVDWGRLEKAFAKIRLGKTARPEGAFTVLEYADKEGIDRSWATKKLKRLVEEGLIQRTPPKSGVTAYYYFADEKETE